MTDAPKDATRVSQCTIVLVHGTWGRGFFPKRREASLHPPNKRRWFEEGSQFQTRLDTALKGASLDWRIRAFLWSGANSVHARDCAARELSNQLAEDLRDPTAKAVIIAHSHGGNVALRALQRLDSAVVRIKVVTLATPFLRVLARRSFQLPFVAQGLVYGAMAMLMWALISALEVFMVDFAVNNKWISEEQAYDGVLYVVVPVLLLSLLLGILIARYLIVVLSSSRVAVAIEEEASYDTRGGATSRMLVIRGVNDDASLSLAAGSIGSGLSYFVLTWVIPGLTIMLGVAFFLSSGLLLFSNAVLDWVGWIFFAMFGTFFCALIFIFLPGIFKSVSFGREFLVNALVCDIAVDSVPDTLGQVEAITLKPVETGSSEPGWISYAFGFKMWWPYRSSERRFGLRWWSEMMRIFWRELLTWKPRALRWSWQLRHVIYDHPDCVDEIVRWLRRVT
jgi:Alpha/beta hydrolase family